MDQIRIMIVDDQRLFASSLKVVLDSSRREGLFVVSVAHDGEECLAHLEAAKPDIILMDARMPGLDGVETTKIIHKKYPSVKILMLSTFDDDTYVHHALRSGAMGYVLKNVEPAELIACIKAVSSGTFLVSSSVGYRVFNNEEAETVREADNAAYIKKVEYLRSRFQRLKRREAEVLYLLLQGLDNHEISQKLFIAEQTVKNYTSAIYKIIGVEDRLHALQMLGLSDKYFGTDSA
jgi:DNA-binding NarL/FixJ family response regulator